MLNVIMPGFWSCYSQAILALLASDPINWMFHSEKIFPMAVKGTYESYDLLGSLQKFDALCLLPLNILNQKLFIIVWVWYIVQLILSISDLFYWFIVSYSEYVRISILYQKSMKSVSRELLLYASHRAHLGQFFVLNQIAKNIKPITFVELIFNLALNAKNHGQNANKSN